MSSIRISSCIISVAPNSMEIRKQFPVLLFSMTIFCFITSASPLISTSSANYEGLKTSVKSLMEIKQQLIDPHAVLDDWDEASYDPCTWSFVTCSPDGLVISLEAPNQGFSGTLAPTIGNLTNIQFLLLRNNNISGPIPSEIGELSRLQTLDLSNNKFSGQIPNTISQLKSLQYLLLANNSLSGEISAPLANLTQPSFIDLSFNNLSGHVPIFPGQIFKIEGNPYICNNGSDKVGCSDIETGLMPSSIEGNPYICNNGSDKVGCSDIETGLMPSSGEAKLSFPSGIFVVYWFFILFMYFYH